MSRSFFNAELHKFEHDLNSCSIIYSIVTLKDGELILKFPSRSYWGFALSLLILLPVQATQADEAESKGLTIAKTMKERNRGWKDHTADLLMILRNRAGKETSRKMRVKSFEVSNDGDKSMTIFDTPRDVKGTAFLSFTHITEADDQWLYLPALKRVKRISSNNKSGPFMGSEFAYEDMSSFEVEKFTYRWLRDEEYGGQLCYVLETIPLDKYSGYSRVELWVDQAEYRSLKVDFYDRPGKLLKTLTLLDYKLYQDKYWRSAKQMMVNHKNGKSSEVMMSNYQFGTGLTAADFTENSLKRAR
jgi:outer membrane lipoprotein-sorting protein